MKLSKKGEYACLALIELSRKYPDNLLKIKEIADKGKIPKKYLEQILLILKSAGYVKSRKGADGGYLLAKSPEQICLAEIIRLIDGALAPVDSASQYFYDATPIETNPPLLAVFKDIRNYISNKLESTTLKDLV